VQSRFLGLVRSSICGSGTKHLTHGRLRQQSRSFQTCLWRNGTFLLAGGFQSHLTLSQILAFLISSSTAPSYNLPLFFFGVYAQENSDAIQSLQLVSHSALVLSWYLILFLTVFRTFAFICCVRHRIYDEE